MCAALDSVKQMRSITTSGFRAAIFPPKLPAFSSLSLSTATRWTGARRRETVRLALSPGHDHDLVALLDEARNEVCPDVARCPDDDDLHGVPPFRAMSIQV